MAGHNPPYAQKMVESVHAVIGCDVYQCTDLTTPQVPGADKIVRRPFVSQLMAYRFEHMIEFGDDPVLWLDSDTIVKKNPTMVWAQAFDVALTIRPQRQRVPLHMPYNTGVMFSRRQDYWKACLDYTLRLDENAQRWYADQYAVAEIARTKKFNVLELDCKEYNWSPESPTEVSDAFIWHYKGSTRKPWLKDL